VRKTIDPRARSSSAWRKRVAAIAVGFLLAGLLGSALGEDAQPDSGFVGPIHVEGNSQLRARADFGDGTPLSPYVIEGLSIDAQSSSYCLVLRNIDAHFILRHCTLAGASTAAVFLENVNNGWIVDCVIERNESVMECSGDTRDIVVSANTLQNNRFDLAGSSTCSIKWDDGYLGNFWDGYTGHDANLDGIGDAPYILSPESESGTIDVDRYPLLEPLTATDESGDGVLLQVNYTVGDAFDILHTVTTSFSVQFLFLLTSETEAEMRTRQRVLGAPGTGLFTIEETVVEDRGTTTVNGFPEPYESSIGVVTIRSVHRLGAMPEPGFGVVSADVAGVTMPAQFPARWVHVGETWSASWTVDAEALDMDEGEERFDATFAFTRFEEIDGQQCAVIDGRASVTMEGRSFDPDLGAWINLTGSGVIETTAFFSVVGKRIVKQLETIDLAIVASAFGMELFTESIESHLTSLEVPIGSQPSEAFSASDDLESGNEAFQQGMALLLRGDFAGAEAVLFQAADLFGALGESELEANALFGAAMAAMRQEKLRDAIPVFEKAAERFRDLPSPHDEAACFNSLGLCYRRLGEHQTALDCYHHVLDLCEGDIETQATALLNIGVCLSTLGDYVQAIERLEEAGVLKDRIPDPDGKIRVLINLGPCYRKLGQFEEALASYDAAISSCTEPSQKVFKATAFQNRGACHMEMGSFDEAMRDLETSRDLWQAVEDPCGEAAAWITTAVCQRTMGNPAAAWASLEHAAGLCATSDIRGSIDYSQAWCRMDFGNPAEALELFDSALAWANEGGDIESAWRCKRGLGRANWDLRQLPDAEMWYERAIEDVEEVRSRVPSEGTRTVFFETVRELYEEYLELLIEMDWHEETLAVAERCRSRTFLDLVAAGPIGTLGSVAEEGIRTGVVEASRIESDLNEVVSGLPTGTAALEYFVTEEATYLWLVRDGSAGEPIRIEIARSDLREQMLTFRTAIETSSTGLMNAPDEATLAMSRDLYELLIAPVEDRLDDIEHLVIVPSGPLYYLPFCALLDCPGCKGPDFLGGKYLVERYTLSYIPSLTTLKYAWAAADEVPIEPLFLALADPDSGDLIFHRLPAAQSEARVISRLFDPNEVYVDADATEEVMTARASEADHVLLSTHGSFNPRNPMFSYLLLSPTEESDGRLYTHEIFSLDLHTSLVTLSACETLLPALEDAKSQMQAVREEADDEDFELTEELLAFLTTGDEIVGLTRAFLYAGTPSVLSSSWSVVSVTTEPLMVAFYGYLEAGLSKAEALRQAQLDVMASYPHPRYWAAFELVGDWRGGEMAETPDTGKLHHELHQVLTEWEESEHPPDESAPMISVLVMLATAVTQTDIAGFEALSERLEIQGAFGRLVQLSLPLSRLEELAGLPRVRAISLPPAAYTDTMLMRRS
jgi:CHAT domain-containing protein/tetratricopeptide (TPR) repeat protein